MDFSKGYSKLRRQCSSDGNICFVFYMHAFLLCLFYCFFFFYINEIALLSHVIFFVLDVSVNLKLHGTNQVNNCKVILLICCLSSERHRDFNLTRILFSGPYVFMGCVASY